MLKTQEQSHDVIEDKRAGRKNELETHWHQTRNEVHFRANELALGPGRRPARRGASKFFRSRRTFDGESERKENSGRESLGTKNSFFSDQCRDVIENARAACKGTANQGRGKLPYAAGLTVENLEC
jgi:hypothetical protein